MLDLSLNYKIKQKLFKNLTICNWVLLMLSLSLLEGSWIVKIIFGVLVSMGVYAYYRSMKFCINCAYPLTRTIFKTTFCPKCGNKLHPGENKNV
jgi:hypothetical protein